MLDPSLQGPNYYLGALSTVQPSFLLHLLLRFEVPTPRETFLPFVLQGFDNALTAACQILSFHLFLSDTKSLNKRFNL